MLHKRIKADCHKAEYIANGRCLNIKNVLLSNWNAICCPYQKFENRQFIVRNKGTSVVEGCLQGTLYVQPLICGNLTGSSDTTLLHRMMEHSQIYPSKSVCQMCLKGKQIRGKFVAIPNKRKASKL